MKVNVNSSNLSEIEYDSENERLMVTFRNGRTYTYLNVSQEAYDDLLAVANTEGGSIGSYFASNIRGVYDYFEGVA